MSTDVNHVECSSNFCQTTTMSENSTTNVERTQALSPYPGDAICPTSSQFDEVSRASFNYWNSLCLEAKEDSEPIVIADKLLNLLQRVPGLIAHPSKGFAIQESSSCLLQYALDWVTTTDQTCGQRIKRTIHYQLLGLPQPRRFKFTEGSECWSPWIGTLVDWDQFSFLVLAWTFILSSRWAETLRVAGEETYLKFSKDGSMKNFWGLVVEQQWQASIVRSGKNFYAPWSLVRLDLPQP